MPHTPFSTAVTAAGSTLSRRRVLTGLVATPAVPLIGAGAVDPAAAARRRLPTITPVWSEAVRRSFGICAHPTYMTRTYRAADSWLPLLKATGAAYFRGRYSPSSPNTAEVTKFCRANGIKWVMTLLPEDWSMTEAELQSRLAHIRDNAADVCLAIEGINEPNHERNGGTPPADWAVRAVRYQKVLWDFRNATRSMRHVKVISPSLWIGGGQHVHKDFKALADAGITRYIDYAGMHSYPGGAKPDNKLDTRLGWVRELWGDNIPYWATETGYTNALNTTSGAKPAPEDVAAIYGPRSILTYFEHGAMSTRFELLDDPNASLTDQEAHFGLVRTPALNPSTWTLKPEFDAIRAFQERLVDPVGSYEPVPVRLRVNAPPDVKWMVVQKSNGSNRILAFRDVSVYDAVTKTRLNPGAVPLTVTDRRGTRVVDVGPNVRGIRIRT
jgi:hypothetical protein